MIYKIYQSNSNLYKKMEFSLYYLVMGMGRKRQNGFLKTFKDIYEKKYKNLLIIPIVLLILALMQIGYQVATTGDFMNKGVSLKGGVTVSLSYELMDKTFTVNDLDLYLRELFPSNDISTRTISSAGVPVGLIMEIDILVDDQENLDLLLSKVSERTGIPEDQINLEGMGSALGSSFFKSMIIAILIAYVLMGAVVFLYFKTPIPSGAVMLAAFSDMVVTLAIVNLLGIKVSTAGIAAFLLMIGYSVDTDILLSIRVLKQKEGTVMERIYSAVSTGLTMNLTTMIAVTIAMIFTQSEVIRQIMIILFIGLIIDIINTWIQNVGILRLYLEKKGQK
jgi:preprotein translocase subunit SecF